MATGLSPLSARAISLQNRIVEWSTTDAHYAAAHMLAGRFQRSLLAKLIAAEHKQSMAKSLGDTQHIDGR
jgi:hypothetical protein